MLGHSEKLCQLFKHYDHQDNGLDGGEVRDVHGSVKDEYPLTAIETCLNFDVRALHGLAEREKLLYGFHQKAHERSIGSPVR